MPYLAARAPSGWQVTHVDEEAENIDWTDRPDVVGITFHTPSAYHAYDLAARFRSQGACVVMGGPHVTLLPDEAGRHADVIFVGEAEGLWEEFLEGFRNRDAIVACTGKPAQRLWTGLPWRAKRSFTAGTSAAASCLPPGGARTTAISAPLS